MSEVSGNGDPLLAGVPEVEGFKVLGGVVIYGKLGAGGMGAVYRGRHLRLNVDVALKIMSPPGALADEQRENYVQRFLREAQTAAQVDHPNLIRVYDVDSKHGLHFLIMQMLEGESAGARLARKKKLTEAEAVAICLGAAEGIAEAHRRGIVHRDIKPDNVMVGPDGRVRVLDLGLAKAVATEAETDDGAQMLTQDNTAMGTPGFMSPEQFTDARDVTPATDAWSLGVMLFHLLAGKLPWEGGTVYVLAKVIQEDPPADLEELRPDVSNEVRKIVDRALQKKPGDRYKNCIEMAEALRERLKALSEDTIEKVLADPDAGTMAHTGAPTPDKLTSIARAVSKIGDSPSQNQTSDTIASEPTMVYTSPGAPQELSPSTEETLPTVAVGDAGKPARGEEDGPSSKLPILVAIVLLVIGIGAFAALQSVFKKGSSGGTSSSTAAAPAPGVKAEEFDLGRGVTLSAVQIMGGRFTRGSPETEPGRRADESPALEVRISYDFMMSATEITQEQYERIMRRNPSGSRGPKRPVEQVTWEDAEAFCKKLSRVVRRKCRLPSEAEWEYACRAGTTTAFSWGDKATSARALFNASASSPLSEPDAAPKETRDVAQFKPNAWGLYDMHGNVAEWCQDWLASNYYAAGEVVDPVGPLKGENRAYRGGSWIHDASAMRSASRAGTWPNSSNSSIGFRVVIE